MAEKAEKEKKVKRSSAKKRDLQSEKRRVLNKNLRSSIRTAVRRFEDSITAGDKKKVQESLSSVYSLLDKAAKTGVFKINKASRTKARLTAKAAKA